MYSMLLISMTAHTASLLPSGFLTYPTLQQVSSLITFGLFKIDSNTFLQAKVYYCSWKMLYYASKKLPTTVVTLIDSMYMCVS